MKKVFFGFRFKSFFNNTSKIPLITESDHFTEPESLTEAEIHFKYKWCEVWRIFVEMVWGNDLMTVRTTNIMHVFAHLSVILFFILTAHVRT